MKFQRPLIIALCFLIPTIVSAQEVWRPAATMDTSVTLQPFLITADDGTYYLPSSPRVDPWLSLQQILGMPEPPSRPMPAITVRAIGDFNGNGKPDLLGLDTNFRPLLILDVFTSEQSSDSTITLALQGNSLQRVTVCDLDGDETEDVVINTTSGNRSTMVVFGSTTRPLQDTSYLKVQYLSRIGTLDGEAAVFHWNWGEGLRFDRISKTSLLQRPDTLELEPIVQEVPQPVYTSLFAVGEQEWLALPAESESTLTNAYRSDEITQRTANAFWSGINLDRFIGQRFPLLSGTPVTLDPERPFLIMRRDTTLDPNRDSLELLLGDLYRFTDPRFGDVERIGTIALDSSLNFRTEVVCALITPDLDNDGLEDVLIQYRYARKGIDEWGNDGIRHLVRIAVYLTSQRPTVSVASGASRGETIHCELTGPRVGIYNVLGEHIATVALTEQGTIAPSDLEALPNQPLWAVSDGCVKRIR